ncbi:hypothetical protein OBBRIDRAFT_806708 [Obba rivulosa]|uniref:Uncharacterized protein n=1 Tax=Obba rivulosa TaxID=1052685 RepID=A0A8E2DI64_9APHY|nr:hypothetical protein OBBRIDRAFT_806708 [Obba rivulosa]
MRPSDHKTELTTVTHTRFDQGVVELGAAMKETLQFMAQELLTDMTNARFERDPKAPTPAPDHDIESFLWMLCCTLLKRLAETQDHNMTETQAAAKDLYSRFFGQVELSTLSLASTGEGPFAMLDLIIIQQALSVPIFELLSRLRVTWTRTQIFGGSNNSSELIHPVVFAALDDDIAALETST